MEHALIMAGGAGTRLWPLSRRQRPKQLLRLIEGRSLLELSCERLRGLFDPARIWVITSADYLAQVAAALPDVPRANLIGEPMGRDTLNAIGLAASLIRARDADATMAVFTADHVITPVERFQAAVQRGLAAATQHADHLVTFGIRPRAPHTGYGYVQRGAALASGVWRVAAFKEKPPRDVAEQYVASGQYAWNSGMFAWRAATILDEIAKHAPENARGLAALAEGWQSADSARRATAFAALPKISIDYAVMEKAAHVLMVEMDVDWRDVGSWTALATTHPADAAGNTLIAPRVLSADSHGNIVVSEDDHLITLLGVRDLVVVRSGDATLICHKDHVEQLKPLTQQRQAAFGEQYE